MPPPKDVRTKVAAAYDAAADTYDAPANSFWERFGRRTIERLGLPLGASVLDVCCGSGASALPAAERVGPRGRVLGIDLAEGLLALARAKAAARGLLHVEFRRGDLLELDPDERFDAVVCVFGIFFVPDMGAALRTLWGAMRPGGTLALTTWGRDFFEPASTAFWNAVRAVRPDLYKGFNPWDRIADPEAVRALLRTAGIERAEIVEENAMHPVPTPEAWWAAVLGSGYRGTLEQLDEGARERVRAANLEGLRAAGVREVQANVIYAVASKPA